MPFQLELKKDGNDWELTFKTSFMNRTTKFTVGIEFEEKNLGGKAIKVSKSEVSKYEL